MVASDAKMQIWMPSVQERYFNFMMGVVLPVFSTLSIGRFLVFAPDPIVRLVFVFCLATSLASSVGLAAHCIYPETGKRFCVQFFVWTGLVFWAPVAFIWCLVTVFLGLAASLLMAGLIKLGEKVINPLRPEGSKFTLKQVFWLTTIIAVLSAALAPLIRFMDAPFVLLQILELFVILSTPVLAAVTFSTASMALKT